MTDTLILRQGWSEGLLPIATAFFGVAILIMLKWSSDDPSIALAEWWVIAIWAIFAIVLVGIQIRRIATKKVWARLSPEGVFNSNGEMLAWDEVTEIRFVLGEIWIGTIGKTLPFVTLSGRVIGQAKMDEAEQYIKHHAPEEKIQKL